ncbi:MAG TPA: 50S ribosomal protein L23 [candidate division WOR-3 bacterium]|uniref:Large ribosomal subunit protein uL23 n=1 Tax=candidate division WOR-3 bacterium TaxID=2052148 RepID=A0A9C9EKX9_UNCW3|nr:50S ribosomal protein L23 [candidate division WOR-3 bacterium]
MRYEKIIKKALITEKASRLREMNIYQFVVSKKANKAQIKEAVEKLFGVQVIDVKTANLPGKPRRLGRSEGYVSGYKKASVTLKQGQTIEIAEGV